MYKQVKYNRTGLERQEIVEGESIETKMERILDNKEPITDGAPIIHTERKDGVQPSYNIRTDRWEVAVEGMDAVYKSITAKRDAKAKADMKIVDDEPIQGTEIN